MDVLASSLLTCCVVGLRDHRYEGCRLLSQLPPMLVSLRPPQVSTYNADRRLSAGAAELEAMPIAIPPNNWSAFFTFVQASTYTLIAVYGAGATELEATTVMKGADWSAAAVVGGGGGGAMRCDVSTPDDLALLPMDFAELHRAAGKERASASVCPIIF